MNPSTAQSGCCDVPAGPRDPEPHLRSLHINFPFSSRSVLLGQRLLCCLCLDFPAEGDAASPKPSSFPTAFRCALTFILTLTLGWAPCTARPPGLAVPAPTPSPPLAHGHHRVRQIFLSISRNKSKARDVVSSELLTGNGQQEQQSDVPCEPQPARREHL